MLGAAGREWLGAQHRFSCAPPRAMAAACARCSSSSSLSSSPAVPATANPRARARPCTTSRRGASRRARDSSAAAKRVTSGASPAARLPNCASSAPNTPPGCALAWRRCRATARASASATPRIRSSRHLSCATSANARRRSRQPAPACAPRSSCVCSVGWPTPTRRSLAYVRASQVPARRMASASATSSTADALRRSASAYLMTPSFFPTFVNAPIAASTCSLVCPADSCTRMRASPRGTTGNENPIT